MTRSAARQGRGLAHFPRGVARAVAAPTAYTHSNGVKPRQIPSDIKEVLFNEEQLAQRVRELARCAALLAPAETRASRKPTKRQRPTLGNRRLASQLVAP